ncbi:hypothetical protein NC651_007942 [Populus alba x Populus x berolinensis]|nr:hypothetical protein NC651_007942 [Populus alba x Populus x berolinensis]
MVMEGWLTNVTFFPSTSFSPSMWLFSVRPGFSEFVFGWLDQQPTNGLPELKKFAICFEEKIYTTATNQCAYTSTPFILYARICEPKTTMNRNANFQQQQQQQRLLGQQNNLQNLQQRLQASGSLLQQLNVIDQQKQLYQPQRALPETSLTVNWGSNVSDMKFGWLDLFASRMSSIIHKIAIVEVLREIRLLSGKSYWKVEEESYADMHSLERVKLLLPAGEAAVDLQDIDLNKNLNEKQRISTESSRASFSSSCSPSMSPSLDCNKTAQPEASSFDRIIFPETPSRNPVTTQPSTSAHLGWHSLDLRDVVKDSMYREARGLSVKTTAKEEAMSHIVKHKDSPRALQASKSADGSYRVGNQGKKKASPVDLKESLKVLAKLHEAPWYYNETSLISVKRREESLRSVRANRRATRGSNIELKFLAGKPVQSAVKS